MRSLTPKQQRFCIEYVRCRNGAKAIRRAGYRSNYARQLAWEMLQEARIRAEVRRIEALLREAADPDEVLQAHFGQVWRVGKEQEDQAGFVYLIRAENLRRVKIGQTVDLKQRLRQLQTASPLELKLVGTIKTDNCHLLEDQIQAQYTGSHIRGDWYNLGDKEIREILESYNGNTNGPSG